MGDESQKQDNKLDEARMISELDVPPKGAPRSYEYIWETFDGLFRTIHRQMRRVEELEARVATLESVLTEVEMKLDKKIELALNTQGTAHVTSPIRRFGSQAPVESGDKIPKFYNCGICSQYHPVEWDGDCRDDNNRYNIEELDNKYGAEGWEEVEQPA